MTSTDSRLDGPPDSLRREAAAWFARMRGPAASTHQADFDRWREGRPDRQAAYDRLIRRWDDAAVLSMSRSNLGLGPARTDRRRRAAPLAIGAAIAAGAMGMAIYLAPARPDWVDIWPVPSAWSQRLATSVGDIRRITLPDGSFVTLDTATVVRWRYSGDARRLVLLRGRARFAVAHDPRRPFLVAAAGGQVAAHGTLFDVSLISGRTVSVTLLQGVVEVEGAASPGLERRTILAPGQELAFGGQMSAPRLRRLPADVASWPTGMLTFASTPLSEAVAEANRYSRTSIRLASADVGRLQVSGAFHAGPARAFAESLATAFDLQVHEGADGALILEKSSAGPQS